VCKSYSKKKLWIEEKGKQKQKQQKKKKKKKKRQYIVFA